MMTRISTIAQRTAARWHAFRASEDGASMVEYALLAALIAIVVIAGVSFFGTSLDAKYDDIGSSLVDAGV
jgi:pilus assembly protein Flp/PilA